eukprot:6154314-Alexandrium_andersonii.AAC.1
MSGRPMQQGRYWPKVWCHVCKLHNSCWLSCVLRVRPDSSEGSLRAVAACAGSVSYTHLRAHETSAHL